MVFFVDSFKFYDYNPDSDGELIVTTEFNYNNFHCTVKGYTNKIQECEKVYTNKRYECKYSRNGKKKMVISYDTYPGYEENEIKNNIRSVIEYCYNKNKKGRKAVFKQFRN